MIPLERKESVKKKYRKWYIDNEEKLEDHFSGYLEKNKKNGLEKNKKNGWVPESLKKVILKFLVETSPQKCAYCERIPNEGGSYLEIEHFYPKSKKEFRRKVFEFENLLLSCSQCNKAKGQRYKNEEGEEILDPYKEKSMMPHLILSWEDMKITGKSPKGKVTVEFLYNPLNTPKYLHDGEIHTGAIFVRKEIQCFINKKLALMKEYRHEPGYLFGELLGLLDLLDEGKSVTATRATVLLNHPLFLELMERLKESDKDKHNELTRIAQSKKRYCLSLS